MKRMQKITTLILLGVLTLLQFDCRRQAGVTAAGAKENLVEIFYLPHPPAVAILQKVEAILYQFPRYTLKKYDFFAAANRQIISEYKLIDHSPIVIFIGGKNEFEINGRTLQLRNFPKGDAFVPSFEGTWTYADLEFLLR